MVNNLIEKQKIMSHTSGPYIFGNQNYNKVTMIRSEKSNGHQLCPRWVLSSFITSLLSSKGSLIVLLQTMLINLFKGFKQRSIELLLRRWGEGLYKVLLSLEISSFVERIDVLCEKYLDHLKKLNLSHHLINILLIRIGVVWVKTN